MSEDQALVDGVTRRSVLRMALVGSVGSLLAACAPAAPAAPTAAPAAQPTLAPKPAAPTVAPAPKPTTAPAAGAKPSAGWDEIVAAAKREGEINLVGAAGSDLRDAITPGFQEKYPEIKIDYNALPGNQLPPKLSNELAAGIHTMDLVVLGTTTALTGLVPINALEPIRPFLVGPQSTDLSKWRDNKLHFSDDAEQLNLVFSLYVFTPLAYNTTQLNGTEFSSYFDLLDPKWNGKMAMLDPRVAGGGNSLASFLYTTEGLGQEFLRRFFKETKVVISRDNRQLLDWLALGQYPVVLGVSTTGFANLVRLGAPMAWTDPHAFKEGAHVTPGAGSIGVIKGGPHPNATKVYLDHFLSAEAQLTWSKATDSPSLRLDVPTDHLPSHVVLRPGVQYQPAYQEKYVRLREEITKFLDSVMTA